MLYWIIYDISNDKARGRVAEKCKNYGLSRVQKSSFLGFLSPNKAEMLALEFDELLSEGDAVFIIPTCRSCAKEKIIVGHLDEEKVRERDFYVVE
ncbi:MAG: CRISPR-associated endonuclease Cas2 [Candidatus Micrarchaeota archaeon]